MTGAGILGTLTVVLGANTAGLVAAQTAVQSFEKNTISSLNRMAQRMRTFGYLSSVTITAPMVMAGKSSLELAKNFEFSMQKIVGLAGVAQSSVNEWRGSLLSLATTLGRSPQELADALYYISSSGIKGAAALDVLEVSAKAASSGLGETQDVANVLTSVLNAYAGTGVTAAYATDVLVAAVREGKAEAGGFTNAIGQLIPIAANLGVSFDQVAGAMAAITLTGSSAANAAVYLKGVFNSLMIAHKDGGKALASVGIKYADLRDMLKGPQGLINVMQKFRDVQLKLGDEAIKQVLPNIRGMTAFMSIAGKNFQYNTELMNRVTNATGSLGVAFAAISNTIKFKMDVAMASVKVSLIELGTSIATVFLPILNKLVKWLNDLVKKFSALTEEQKRHKLIMFALIAAAGPLSLVLSTLMYTISGLVTAVNALGNVWTFLLGRVSLSTAVFKTAWIATEALRISLSMLTLGGLALMVAWAAISPVIERVRNKIAEMKKQVEEMKSALEFTTPSMELDKSIGKQMQVLNTLNRRQIEDLRNNIAQRIALEEDRLTASKTIGIKDIKNEQEVLKQRQAIADNLLNLEHLKKTEGWSTTDIENWSKASQYFVEEANQAISDYVQRRLKEVEYEKTSAQTVINFYNMQATAVEKAYKKMIDPIETATRELESFIEQQTKVAETWNDLQSTLSFIGSKSAVFKDLGIEFDNTKESTEAYTTALDALLKLGLDPTNWMVLEITKNLVKLNHELKKTELDKYYNDFTEGINKQLTPKAENYDYTSIFGKMGDARKGMGDDAFLQKFQKELDLIALKSTAVGERFNVASAQAQYFKTTLEQLWDAGNGKVTPLMITLATQMNAYVKEAEKAQIISSAFSNGVVQLAEAMGSAIGGMTDAWSSMAMIILQTTQQIIGALLAQAAANVYLAATAIARKEAMKGIWGLVTAAIGIAALIAMMQKANQDSKSAGMAKGGIVPQGYPNDSYPARLTSGETVVPPGKLPNLVKPSNIHVTVDGKILGKDLALVLRRANAYN